MTNHGLKEALWGWFRANIYCMFQVAVKKEILSKTIQERFDQAVKETEILNMVDPPSRMF